MYEKIMARKKQKIGEKVLDEIDFLKTYMSINNTVVSAIYERVEYNRKAIDFIVNVAMLAVLLAAWNIVDPANSPVILEIVYFVVIVIQLISTVWSYSLYLQARKPKILVRVDVRGNKEVDG